LRNRVIIETDGKLLSGRDVAIAAILGAEEFGFATGPLVTMGCVMMRVCNKDTCPGGVATQNPELRKRFSGKPEYVVNFMRFIAEELREYMAMLGVKTVDELVGRYDLLKVREDAKDIYKKIDLTSILGDESEILESKKQETVYEKKDVYDFKLPDTVDEKILIKKLSPKKNKKDGGEVSVSVKNTDRALGTLLGAEITRECGDSLPEDTYKVHAEGAGGQSFGAFIPGGLTIDLKGDSNDYFGKGLSGGKLIVYPPENTGYEASENIIVGNVALYGATSGKAFISGVAGERFAVRNSGATAVVEGCGDHGCEYMTGGRAVIMGPVGKNFAAGMSGGIAYVLDPDDTLYKRLNKDMVSLEPVTDKYDVQELKNLIDEHVKNTGSKKGKKILSEFADTLNHFKKIIPHDYKKMIETVAKMEEKGLSHEQAEIEAFSLLTK
ncbi:MAG: glutamate synthase large subunit, partial [Lachnospiraceae bacterium]|nr:glutamate synthase large subunit [Lachnospiraceae bacterium]